MSRSSRNRGAEHAFDFSTQCGQLHKNPKCNHQGKANNHGGNGNTRAHRDHTLCTGGGHAGKPGSHRRKSIIHPIGNALVLKDVGVLRIDVIPDVAHLRNLVREGLKQRSELFTNAEHWRKEHPAESRYHHAHKDISHTCSPQAANAFTFQIVNWAPQTENDDGRPDNNGHGSGQNVERPPKQIQKNEHHDNEGARV